jgi:uncharacterized repeat protein (TIGR01451 family)/fimbrial isopeptide formation D2 family protein
MVRETGDRHLRTCDTSGPGRLRRRLASLLAGVVLLAAFMAPAAAAPAISNTKSLAGNINYVVTGGSLRTQPNAIDPCAVQATSSAAISGVPAGATIRAAYLYFVGDGDTPDYGITFNGYALSADAQYTDTLTFLGEDYHYYGGVVDVTSYVGGNGTYTFGGLAAQVTDTPGGALYCTYQGVIAGWGLVVVYEKSTEPLRVINIFDGLEHFYGTSLSLNPGNFKIPSGGIDGKMTTITWGGDDDINTAQNGLNEALRFNGTLLTDAYNPANNQYNATINTLPSTTSWGVDIDTFDVGAYLSPGQTSATTLFSTGADDVYLTAQVVSVTNEPVADLSIDSSHSGSWIPGGSRSYTLTVHNNGPQPATGTTTVTDTLPAGLTYASASGSGWSCGFSAPTVTCTTASSVASGANLPAITLGVTVDAGAPASVNNTATVSNATFDNVSANNTDVDATAIAHPNLSTSAKVVADQDGGDASPGDTLRYTITLTESAGVAATAISASDTIPADLDFAGGLDASSTCVGNSSGTTSAVVSVTGIALAANASCTIVYDTTIKAGTANGTQIDNTATVSLADPYATGGTTPAASVTVNQSQVPAVGNKKLYVYDNSTLTRTPQSGAGAGAVSIANDNGTHDWTSVALQKPLTIAANSTISVNLMVECGNQTAGGACRNGTKNFTAALYDNTVSVATRIGSVSPNAGFNFPTWTLATANIAIGGADVVVPAGHVLILRITNVTTTNQRPLLVEQYDGGTGSMVSMSVTGSISVDSVGLYTTAYAGTTQKSSYLQNDVVYVRAVASDAFGGSDVGSAQVTITDPNGIVRLGPVAMGSDLDASATTATFEKQYTLPGTAAVGNWTASVTAYEGSEATVSQTRNTSFLVGLPVLSIAKSHAGNFAVGSNATYGLVVTNNSLNPVAGTTTVTDTLPAGLSFVSGTGSGWSCSAAGQAVTCTTSATVNAGASLPSISLVVAVTGAAGAGVANQAFVANPNVNGGAAQAGNTDTATVLRPDLSGPGTRKDVADLNGGDAALGDTLRYTITLAETAGVAAGGVSVTDTIPANVTFGGTIDASSTCAGSTAGTTASLVSVTGITVPANGSCTVVFDVAVATSTPGATINNTATVDNPNGPGASPVAPLVTVLQSQVASTGDKVLYVYANQTMSRTKQAASASFTVPENSSRDFTLSGLKKPLVLTPGGTVTVALVTSATGGSTANRTVTAQLFKNGTTQVGTANGTTPVFNSTTPTLRTFTFTVAGGAAGSLAATDTLVLRVTNGSSGNGVRDIAIEQFDGSNRSTVSVPTTTVINVDSVETYAAAWNATTQDPRYFGGNTVYVRAVISDPFGSDDVNHASATITDPAGTVKVNGLPMNLVAEDTANGTRTYEYTYVLPANARLGSWTTSVRGYEGTENTISHARNGSFNVEGAISLGNTWGAGSPAGNTVALSIAGGTTTTAGGSTAPSTTTPATATSGAGATITLGEAFSVGNAASYTITLACSRTTDSATVVVDGTGLSRTIVMPADSGVTCTWDNSRTVPVTVVKLSSVQSDPVDGTTNPKAIPGAVVEYQVIITNPATTAVDANTLFMRDPLPPQVVLRVADLGGAGSGPVSFANGIPPSGLTYGFVSLGSLTDDLQFSNDHGASWNYVPVPDIDGYDAAITGIRVNPKGAFNGNGAQFTLRYRVRIK